MKKIFFSLVCIFIITGLNAQQNNKQLVKEVYITTKSLELGNMGLQYKRSINENTFFRVCVLDLNLEASQKNSASSMSYPTDTYEMNGNVEFGLEKRRKITEKLSCFYGIDLLFEAGVQRIHTDNPTYPLSMRNTDFFHLNPGLGFGSGILLFLKEGFYLGAAVNPAIVYQFNRKDNVYVEEGKDKNPGVSIKLGTVPVSVSFMYRWNK